MKKSFLILAVFLLGVISPLRAVEDRAGGDADIRVTVTAERILQPVGESIASTTVIPSRQIRESGAQTAAEAIRMAPGVVLRQAGQPGSAATAYLRGARQNQVLVLLDGQRLYSPAFFGGTDLSKIPAADIERIEIIHGPVSALYGSEAIGGVINIITRKPEGPSGRAALGFGGHGRVEKSLLLNGGREKLFWQFSGSLPEYGGMRPNSDWKARDYSGKVRLEDAAGWELALKAESYYDELGLPGADPNHTGYYDPDSRQWWLRNNFDFSATRQIGAGRLEARWYSISQQLRNLKPGPSGYESRISGLTRAGEAVYRLETGPHKLIFGGELRQEDYDDVEGGYSPATLQNSLWNRALYFQDRWSISSRADLVLGARWDDHSAFGGKFVPRAGLSHRTGKDSRLRLSYSEGFRAPNFVELYYPAGPWGPGFSGNPDLKPEQSRQYEAGWNLMSGKSSLDLAFFSTEITDLIQATSATPYRNVGRAREQGVEFSFEHRFSSASRLLFNFTSMDARNQDSGERLAGIPEHQGNLAIYTMVKGWDLALSGRWSDNCTDMAFDPVTWVSWPVVLPSRTVFDFSITGRRPHSINPYVIVRNILDLKYDEIVGYRAEDRTLEMGMRYAW
jgi:outer membrane receptor for ferrienterochelin and colicins